VVVHSDVRFLDRKSTSARTRVGIEFRPVGPKKKKKYTKAFETMENKGK